MRVMVAIGREGFFLAAERWIAGYGSSDNPLILSHDDG